MLLDFMEGLVETLRFFRVRVPHTHALTTTSCMIIIMIPFCRTLLYGCSPLCLYFCQSVRDYRSGGGM